MAVVGVVSTLLAGAFALWMSTFKISRPLVRMIERMRALAQGDLEVEIDGLDRGDEVGEMAKAVQVFKTNAIERVRVEKEATEHRAEVETERRRVEAEKARAAETQTQAMSQLGDGLRRLAGGDLTSRLDQRFPAEFAKIRDDFNAAASKLMETVRAVVASTSAIHAGSHEISTSSDDLSRRTEQQAARLEETAAALDEITATLKKSAEGRQAGGGRGRQRRRQRQEGRGRRQAGGRGDGRDRQIVGADRPDHRRHRRDRVPDQSAGAQRRRRGGARRRRRPRLRGRRLRSARARPALGGGRQGDQEPDLDVVEPGRLRRPAGRRIRQGARPHHRPGVEDQRHRRRDRHQRRSSRRPACSRSTRRSARWTRRRRRTRRWSRNRTPPAIRCRRRPRNSPTWSSSSRSRAATARRSGASCARSLRTPSPNRRRRAGQADAGRSRQTGTRPRRSPRPLRRLRKTAVGGGAVAVAAKDEWTEF